MKNVTVKNNKNNLTKKIVKGVKILKKVKNF